MSPPVTAGMPMRAPTTMPAPKVEADSSTAPSSGTRPDASPAAKPAATPPPSLPIERRSSAGSVSARRMLATARPEGKARRIRSTRMGVYSMPMPAPNMPMHSM